MYRQNLKVDPDLQPFIQEASARLRYLFPKVEFYATSDTIEFELENPATISEIREEINYALYRAKVRSDGIANRTALYSAVFK
jgi:hypothetical protein